MGILGGSRPQGPCGRAQFHFRACQRASGLLKYGHSTVGHATSLGWREGGPLHLPSSDLRTRRCGGRIPARMGAAEIPLSAVWRRLRRGHGPARVAG